MLRQKNVLIRIFPLLILIGFLSWSSLKAQNQPANGVWSLEECIQYAIKNNITIQQSELQIQTSNNNLYQSKLSRYPSVNASASQGVNFGRSIDPFSNDFVNQRVNSNNFSVTASLNIFNGFQTKNTILQNEKIIEVNKLNAEQSRYNVSLNVALGYLNILLNRELLDVAQKNVESTRTQMERTQKLFDAGAAPEVDVINIKSTLANNELAVVNAQNQLDISKATLQQLMNLPITANFDVKEVQVEQLNVNQVIETTEQIYGTAEGSQPNVKSADKSIESSEYGVALAKSNRYPSLTLNASLFSGYSSVSRDPLNPTGDYPFFNQLDNNFRQQVSLNLSIPIFNNWQVKNQISNSIISRENSKLVAKNVRNQLRIDIENAYVTAKSAYNTYQARIKQVEAQELNFSTTEMRYNAGASNVVDLNLARITRDNSRSDLVRAKYDYLFRKKVIDFYMNKPLSID